MHLKMHSDTVYIYNTVYEVLMKQKHM